MRYLIFSVLFFGLFQSAISQDKPAYLIINAEGQPVSFTELSSEALQNRVILFGELHNNPIAHWLQLELVKSLHQDTLKTLSIGMEMFEADNQVLINEYFSGLINQRNFEQEARLWPNYKTDIKPVVEYARENELKLIATNIPRRYASMVYNSGLKSLESLSDEAQKWIAPLPIKVDLELPGYKNIMEMSHGHGGENLPHSQAVKDATMAHFILMNLPEGTRLIHLHGTYHSNNYEGINWYLRQQRPLLDILTIATAEADNLFDGDAIRDMAGQADYTIIIPRSMTKTH